MTPVFGRGVVYDAPRAKRSQQMQFLGNGLRSAKLRTYVDYIIEECGAFFHDFDEQGEFNLKKSLAQLTILTSSRALMGHEVRASLFGEVAAIFTQLDQGITPLSVFFPRAPVPVHIR